MYWNSDLGGVYRTQLRSELLEGAVDRSSPAGADWIRQYFTFKAGSSQLAEITVEAPHHDPWIVAVLCDRFSLLSGSGVLE
jgi:hypothetical protein